MSIDLDINNSHIIDIGFALSLRQQSQLLEGDIWLSLINAIFSFG